METDIHGPGLFGLLSQIIVDKLGGLSIIEVYSPQLSGSCGEDQDTGRLGSGGAYFLVHRWYLLPVFLYVEGARELPGETEIIFNNGTYPIPKGS